MSARIKPRCSVWTPRLPPLCAKPLAGGFSVASASTLCTVASHFGFRLSAAARRPRPRSARSVVVGERTARPYRATARRARPASGAWLSSVPSPRPHNQSPTVEMVGDFLDRLGGDLGDPRRRVDADQAFEKLDVPGVEQELPHQRHAEIAVRPLDEQHVAKLGGVAQIGELCRRCDPRPRHSPQASSQSRVWPIRSSAILASAMSSSSTGAWPHHSDSAMAEDQRVVAGPQQKLEQRFVQRRAFRRRSSHVPHFVGDVVERRMTVDLGVRRLEQRPLVRRARGDDVVRPTTQMLTPSLRRV